MSISCANSAHRAPSRHFCSESADQATQWAARRRDVCFRCRATILSSAPPCWTRCGVESSIDRVGGDYKSFEVKNDEGDEACRAACTADNKCRAWTYARPGYVGKEAHCFLKKDIKPPRHKAGYMSGVVR